MLRSIPLLRTSALLLFASLILLPLSLQCLLLVAYSIFFTFRLNRAPAIQVSAFFNGFRLGGHRGSPTNAPENTMASLKLAASEGADLVEFDVGMTRDGVPVLMHDDTLERTTNLSGLLREHAFAALATECDCAAKFRKVGGGGDRVERAPICTVDETVRWAKERGIKLLFDVKDADVAIIDKLDELFKQYDLYDIAIVCSFFPAVLYRMKRRNSRILTGMTWRRWLLAYRDLEWTLPRQATPLAHRLALLLDVILAWSVRYWLPQFLGVDMVLIERGEISANYVKDMRAGGLHVCAWTVNDTREMAWMAQKLQMPFLTDLPSVASPLMKTENLGPTSTFELN